MYNLTNFHRDVTRFPGHTRNLIVKIVTVRATKTAPLWFPLLSLPRREKGKKVGSQFRQTRSELLPQRSTRGVWVLGQFLTFPDGSLIGRAATVRGPALLGCGQ